MRIFQFLKVSKRVEAIFHTVFKTKPQCLFQNINRRFFYNEPFWDTSKNYRLQIFVKMDLKCSIHGPEHKMKRLRSIEDFWKLVEVGKFCDFWQKQHYVRRDILLKKSLNIQVFMINFSSKRSKKKFHCIFWDLAAVPSKLGGHESNHNILQKAWFAPTS
jgi:hypothetical protein